MAGPRLHWLGLVVFVLPPCFPAPARAEVGAGVSIESDYQLRGVSLSDGRPAVSLNLSYDHASGAYGAISGVFVDSRHSGAQVLGYVANLGYARRLASGVSWDVGVINSGVTTYVDYEVSSTYTEVYAGVSKNDLSLHVYYSPKYIGEGGGSVYVDFDGALRPANHWRIFGHVGALARLGARNLHNVDATRIDFRVGVAREFKHFELHAAWTATTPTAVYPAGYRQDRTAFVVGAACFF